MNGNPFGVLTGIDSSGNTLSHEDIVRALLLMAITQSNKMAIKDKDEDFWKDKNNVDARTFSCKEAEAAEKNNTFKCCSGYTYHKEDEDDKYLYWRCDGGHHFARTAKKPPRKKPKPKIIVNINGQVEMAEAKKSANDFE